MIKKLYYKAVWVYVHKQCSLGSLKVQKRERLLWLFTEGFKVEVVFLAILKDG